MIVKAHSFIFYSLILVIYQFIDRRTTLVLNIVIKLLLSLKLTLNRIASLINHSTMRLTCVLLFSSKVMITVDGMARTIKEVSCMP